MPGRFTRPLTLEQERAVRELGASDASVRRAAVGPDVFVYVDEDESTLRYQIGPGGYVLRHARLTRRPVQRAAGGGDR